MPRSPGGPEGYRVAEERPPLEWGGRLAWYPLRSAQPWPLDWVEPVAWEVVEET